MSATTISSTSRPEARSSFLGDYLGSVGRTFHHFSGHLARVLVLFAQMNYWTFLAPWRERTEHRRSVFQFMVAIGNRSFFIIALVATLVGATLVLNTGKVLETFQQVNQLPVLVAITITRELGPLMTAILLVARVGSAYTGGLGVMTLNNETLALETMAINPVGFLVAPRWLAVLVMAPALTVFANFLGILGGCVVGWAFYGLTPALFVTSALDSLVLKDLVSGLLKAVGFGTVLTTISCYFGLKVQGGPEGLSRNIMISVVSCAVAIIFMDMLFTAVLTRWF